MVRDRSILERVQRKATKQFRDHSDIPNSQQRPILACRIKGRSVPRSQSVFLRCGGYDLTNPDPGDLRGHSEKFKHRPR